MRKVIAATLALSPMLLHAQARMPAQPSPALVSTLAKPIATNSSTSSDSSASLRASSLRVSSGVVNPKLVHTVAVYSDNDWYSKITGSDRTVVVGMIVDTTGRPTNLKVIRSSNPVLDRNVLEAVSQYRYIPGTVDNQPTEIPVTLEVVVREAGR